MLVGGSSRIPLVTQLISAELGRPVAIDADPKAAIALGAALSALPTPTTAPDAPSEGDIGYRPVDGGAVTEAAALAAGSELPATTPAEVPQRPSLTALPLDVEPAELQWRNARSRRVKQVVLAGALAVFTVAGVASVPFLTSRSGPIPPANAGTSTSSTPAAPNVPVPGVPSDAPAPGATVPAPNAAIGSDNSSNSGGPIRTAPRATPNRPAGGPAPVAPSAPPPSWVTPYTWTSTWSSPPPATTTPPPTTTEDPPPPPTTTAVVTTTAVATTAPHTSHGHSR
ncbi:MAG TPA: Hsp70 family protein [Pseudonocardiaceae bacterium]|nr:Hsp70 family protein [Pseudonocardiaceae bacterium]